MTSSRVSTILSLALSTAVLAACGGRSPQPPPPPPVSAPDDAVPEAPQVPPTDDLDEVEAEEPPAVAIDLDVPVTLTEVATGTSFTAAATGPDGTLYVAERAGTVHPVTDDGLGEAVVDLSAETTTDGERGLLGLAFAADGSELYLSSTGADGGNVLSAVPVDGDAFDSGARRTLYTLDQPRGNHNGGGVAVGPDGRVFLSVGDGGGGGDPFEAGQDLSTPLGSLLRFEVRDGELQVPADNPFVDVEGARPEIFAYGLRNPWRFTIDHAADELWIADVGQNTREEVNRVALDEAAGANFGWNLMEGTLEFAGSEPEDHVAPVYEYDTGGPEGCSITGGHVYRGAAIPELTGVYLYADFCNGTVRGLAPGDDGQVTQGSLDVDGGQVVSFAQDADGEVYVLDLGGRLLRLDPA